MRDNGASVGMNNPLRGATPPAKPSGNRRWRTLAVICLWMLLFTATGCGLVMRSVTGDLAGNLADAMVNNKDPETVASGGAAYLIMIDALVAEDPENEALLLSAAKLYGQYAGAFVSDGTRGALLSEKAVDYARQALCLRKPGHCKLMSLPFPEFEAALEQMTAREVPALYLLGSAWANLLQFRKNDWNAIADLPRLKALMERVTVLSPHHADGGAYLYLGVFATLVPEAMGGAPEQGRGYFETAMRLSGGKNLMVPVLYARYYARLVFDQALHDRLLRDALGRDPEVPGYVLQNVLAQREARALLDSSGDYF